MTIISKITAIALKGTCATDADIFMLKALFPTELVPEWLVVLLREFKLGGASISLEENDDNSGMGAELKWLTPPQMVSEALECEPGRSVLKIKLLPVAACATGSGDPYFLDLRAMTIDPPLVRVLHDFVSEEGECFPLQGVEVVSYRLSDFFSKATVN